MKYTQEQIAGIFRTYKKRKIPQRHKNHGEIKKSFTKETLEYLYNHLNKSLQDIADEYKCTRQMIKYLMEEYGIQRRRRGKARILAIKKGKFKRFEYHDINEHIFSEWSSKMAWVLGILFTDGCMHSGKAPRVTLSSMDFELVKKVKEILESSKPIMKRTQSYDKSRHIYSFEFYREKMSEDLQKLGLVPRKSLVMEFPNVPEEYKRHFIRGCWDGDGSIFLSAGKLRASYISGSKAFVLRLVDELYKVGMHRKILHAGTEPMHTIRMLRAKYPAHQYSLKIHVGNRSKSSSYSIKVVSHDNLLKLYNYFYAGVDESIYLRRKHDIFFKGLGLQKDENNNTG